MVDKRKVVLVGTGFVGMSMVYALENQGGINEIVLIDILKEKAIGEAMDLADGIPCASTRMDIKAGEYEDCKDADIVVITAGLAQKPGQTRLELALENAQIIKVITKDIIRTGFDGIFVVATNPVDLMTHVVQKESDFPHNRVIGSGTVLDTARLRYAIGEKLKVSPKNIHAYVMGEHGDSSFVPWSCSYVGCRPLIDIINEKNEIKEELDNIYVEVRDKAYEIINKKKATYYGIGMGLARLVKTILNNENEILTVSAYLNNNYGHSGIYIGVPAVITNRGIREILNLKLSLEEQKKFNCSFEVLNNMKIKITENL